MELFGVVMYKENRIYVAVNTSGKYPLVKYAHRDFEKVKEWVLAKSYTFMQPMDHPSLYKASVTSLDWLIQTVYLDEEST